ncbi:MAG TPA: hypothetical protein VF099_17685 [Ktedonobacterales bacterium]
MSSKMRAGLIAGCFFVAFIAVAIGLLKILPSLAIVLIALTGLLDFFCVGIVSGILAAIWLDLEDYGSQFAAGGFAGAIASLVVYAGNLGLTGLLLLIHQPNPTDSYSQLGLSSLSLGGQVLVIILQVIVRLLLFLIYMVASLVISGLTTRIVASGKSIKAVQAMIAAREEQARQSAGLAPPTNDELGPSDPALLPYRRPEYSPFVDNQQQQQVISPWQRRRLEREGKLPPEDASSGGSSAPQAGERGPVYRVYPPPKWRRPPER